MLLTSTLTNGGAKKESYNNIPNNVYAYWVSDGLLEAFNKKQIKDFGNSCIGMRTGDNERFLRLWFEVDYSKLGLGFSSADKAQKSEKKWFPYCKGGSFRKWYGNNDYVVNWENDGFEIKENTRKVYPQLGDNLGWKISNEQFYFKPGLTWSGVGASVFGVRSYPQGMIFDSGANSFFVNEDRDYYYFAGLLNTKLIDSIINIINPTINTGCGVVAILPAIYDYTAKEEIEKLVKENIEASKQDWDNFETSWDFERHPLLRDKKLIEEAFDEWERECEERFQKVKQNEERLNQIFNEIYSMQHEMSPSVDDDVVTVRRASRTRDIRSLISYAVGCMFGRYSLEEKGIIEDVSKINFDDIYFDEDNIIPVTEEGYFKDDIVNRFCNWLGKAFGEEYVEQNLKYITDSLEIEGATPKEILRKYFEDEFIKDHGNTYSVTGSGKRPIYWMFSSGKQNGFKCLIYVHRYDADCVGRIRTEYLHKSQKAIEQALETAERLKDNSVKGTDKSKATKQIANYTKQLAEIKQYDEAMAHVANQRIEIDLDDGVKANYAKFQGIEISQEGKKAIKIDLLAPIK